VQPSRKRLESPIPSSLEALWWVDDWETFNIEDKSNWQWTAMICQPQEAGRHASLLPAIADRKKLVAGDKVR
jgi:hypothetical protein